MCVNMIHEAFSLGQNLEGIWALKHFINIYLHLNTYYKIMVEEPMYFRQNGKKFGSS